jgi:hypothetical protein
MPAEYRSLEINTYKFGVASNGILFISDFITIRLTVLNLKVGGRTVRHDLPLIRSFHANCAENRQNNCKCCNILIQSFTVTFYFFNTNFNIIISSSKRSPTWFWPWDFLTNMNSGMNISSFIIAYIRTFHTSWINLLENTR